MIVKDARSGEPTGALKESAMRLVSKVAPTPTTEDKLAAIRAALNEANRLGVTSVQNAGGDAADFELYDRLRKRRELSARVYQAVSIDGPPSRLLRRHVVRRAQDHSDLRHRRSDQRWRHRETR